MESVIRNVRDIDTGERRALEHVLGQQLQENQQVIIQVVTLGIEPEKHEDGESLRARQLPEWCEVYAGLSDEQVADAESVILQRSDLTRTAE